MGCPKLKTGNWVFLRGGEKHLLFPRFPREKNRSRSAPAEMDGGWNLYGFIGNDPVGRWDWRGLDRFYFKGETVIREYKVYFIFKDRHTEGNNYSQHNIRGKGIETWSEARRASYKNKYERGVENDWNNHSYKIVCIPKRNKKYTPVLDIVIVDSQRDADLIIYVIANKKGKPLRSMSDLGGGKAYLDEDDVVANKNGHRPASHEFGHSIGWEHPGYGVDHIIPGSPKEYRYKGQDKNGRDVNGEKDLMGVGGEIRGFYLEAWKNYVESQKPQFRWIIEQIN
jgi:hypothetical protein